MSVLTATAPTLLDFAKRLDPDDRVALIIELLNQRLEMIQDIPFIEGNLLTGHRTIVRTGLPSVTWRKLYGGIQPSKSTTTPVTDNCGSLEAYAEVDAKLVELNSNQAAFRFSEDRAFIEAMAEELSSTLIYGNEGTEPEAFTGLAPRFNSKSAENGDHIIDGGGSSNLTSIWLVCWGDLTVHGIYPMGSKAGFSMEDKGKVTTENIDGNQGRAEIYRTHYMQDAGLTVRDWRYIVRIANIDVTALVKDAATGPDLIDLMAQSLEVCQDLQVGTPRFYMPRVLRSYLRRQIANKVRMSTLTMENVAGKHVMMFDEVPVRRVDSILTNETQVS